MLLLLLLRLVHILLGVFWAGTIMFATWRTVRKRRFFQFWRPTTVIPSRCASSRSVRAPRF